MRKKLLQPQFALIRQLLESVSSTVRVRKVSPAEMISTPISETWPANANAAKRFNTNKQ